MPHDRVAGWAVLRKGQHRAPSNAVAAAVTPDRTKRTMRLGIADTLQVQSFKPHPTGPSQYSGHSNTACVFALHWRAPPDRLWLPWEPRVRWECNSATIIN